MLFPLQLLLPPRTAVSPPEIYATEDLASENSPLDVDVSGELPTEGTCDSTFYYYY